MKHSIRGKELEADSVNVEELNRFESLSFKTVTVDTVKSHPGVHHFSKSVSSLDHRINEN